MHDPSFAPNPPAFLSRRPSLRGPCVVALVLTATLGAAAGSRASGAAPDEDGAKGGAAAAATPPEKPKGPIEQLIADGKAKDAIAKVEDLRKTAPKHVADAESEFWAGKAELVLKLYDAANDRFALIIKTYPDNPRAAEAAVELGISPFRQLDGLAKTDAEKKLAIDSAKKLDEAGRKYASNKQQGARAFYIAGNAWRVAGDEKAAVADWEKVRKDYTEGDYPGKAIRMIAVYELRDFKPDKAKDLYQECVSKLKEPASLNRCQRALDRIAIIGKPAPPLNIETWLNSPAIDLASLKGNVVLLWFFATWCPHCQATMPDMATLHTRYAGKPFRMLAITANTKEQTTEKAKAFVEQPEWKINYPAAVDQDGQTSEAYQSSNVPAAVLIDKKGIIRWADHPSFLSDDMINRLIAE